MSNIIIRWYVYQNVAAKVDLASGSLVEIRLRRIYGRNYDLDDDTVEVTDPIVIENAFVLIFHSNGCQIMTKDDYQNYFKRYRAILVKKGLNQGILKTETLVFGRDQGYEPISINVSGDLEYLDGLKNVIEVYMRMGEYTFYQEVRNTLWPVDREDYTYGNRAGMKLAEIDHKFGILKGDRFLDLAGAPGGFTKYMLSQGMTGVGISLITEDTPISDQWFEDLRDEPHFVIDNGKTGDGNLLIIDNFNEWVRNYSASFDVVTCDGGFATDGKGDQSKLTEELVRKQIVLADICTKVGGSMLVKLFQLKSEKIIDLINSTSANYDVALLVKPPHSRRVNSEKYLLLMGKKQNGIVATGIHPWVERAEAMMVYYQIKALFSVINTVGKYLNYNGKPTVVIATNDRSDCSQYLFAAEGNDRNGMALEGGFELGKLDYFAMQEGARVRCFTSVSTLSDHVFGSAVILWLRPDERTLYPDLIELAEFRNWPVHITDMPDFLNLTSQISYPHGEPNVTAIQDASVIYKPTHKVWDLRAYKGLSKGMTVLDYGCGDGSLLIALRNKFGIRPIGVDVALQVSNIEYYNVNEINQIPDESVDYVICNMTLHHVDNVFKAIGNMRRVLKVGGTLYLTEHDVIDFSIVTRVDALHMLFHDKINKPVGYFAKRTLRRIFIQRHFSWEDVFQNASYPISKMKKIMVKMPDGILPIFFMNHEHGTRMSRVSRLGSYLAELVYQRFSKYLLYAFPGSGKTTWINRTIQSVGYKAIDTDDFLKTLQQVSDTRKYHEIAFHTATVFNSDTPNVLVTNYHGQLFLAYMRKLGFTLVAVKLDDQLWKSRFNTRQDLIDAKLPWESWRKDVNYDNFDIVLDDFDVMSDLIYVPCQIQGYGLPISGKQSKMLVSHVPLMSDYGHYVRKSVMMWLKKSNLEYIGLGDEIESVLDADEVGVRATFVGNPASKPMDEKGEYAMERIINMNLYDYIKEYKHENGVFVSLWAISNIGNLGLKDDMKRFKGKDFILMYPNLHTARLLPYGFDNNYVSGKSMKTKRGERLYEDILADPYHALDNSDEVITLEINDFLAYINHTVDGQYIGPEGRFYATRNNYMSSLWFIVMSKKLFSFVQWQTWFNTQTYKVRLISIPIRRYLAVDSDSLHKFRRLALKQMYDDSVTIKDARVNGYRIINGNRFYICVSGHIMNLLMYSMYGVVDFARYVDTIEGNITLYSTKYQPSELKILLGKDLLAEDNSKKNIFRLWHSYDDFFIGIAAYNLLCSSLRLPYNARAVAFLSEKLLSLRNKYPSFSDMGWQAKLFSERA